MAHAYGYHFCVCALEGRGLLCLRGEVEKIGDAKL